MINLIPPKAKRNILIEYWVRVVSVWLMLGSAVLLMGATLLLPVYVLIGKQVSAKELAVDVASQKVTSFENVSTDLALASKLARYALAESDLSAISDYVILFESLQGASIEITNIEIYRNETGISPMKVSGVARDRKTLAAFRDSILDVEDVEEVDLPISNLASDKDIEFTITVKLRNNSDV